MVKYTLKNSKQFLFKSQNTIISAALVLAVMYGISAILGFVRARLLAHYFGASEVLGVFYTADKIPSLIYSLLVVGTLSTVFIPVFTKTMKKNEADAWKTSSSMITVSVLLFSIIGIVVFYFSPFVISALSLNRFGIEQVTLGSNLMRMMLAAQLVLIVSSFMTSILHSFKYFIIPALAPVVYNIGMILGIVFLVPSYGIYGPAIGVVFGSLLHFLVQIPVLKKVGFRFTLKVDLANKGMKEIFKLLPGRLLSSSLAQVSAIINNSLAILVSTSSVVYLKFADQLQSFPVLFFGASIAAAALPTLSSGLATEDIEKFKKTFLTSFYQMLFMVVPASVILLVLRVPLVRLVFGASTFPWDATIITSYTLAFFSLSIFAQASILLLSRAFYAMYDTITPVVAGFSGLLISVFLAISFVSHFKFGVWSVALAFSIGSIVYMLLLFWLLSIRVGGFGLRVLLIPFTKISYAGIFMGLSLYVPMKLLDIYVLDTSKTVYLIVMTCVVSVAGMLSYLFFTKLFKVEEIELLYKLFKKLQIKKFALLPVSDEHAVD